MTKTKKTVEKVSHQIKVGDVNKNDLMAFVYYGKVADIAGEVLKVKNSDSDMDFQVQGKELIERGCSADQFQEEIKVTKTRAAEILITSYNRPFTVCFEKQSGGGERVLRGRLVAPEPLLGRSMVEDLDLAPNEHRQRLVDHRTIKYLIVNGSKYVVGK